VKDYSYWINLIIFIHNRKNYSKGVIEGVYFHKKVCIRDLVDENRHRDEYFFRWVKNVMKGIIKFPRDIIPSKIG